MDNYELAATLLKGELGDLDDLPPELQNTISNIYYKANPSTLVLETSGDVIDDFKTNSMDMVPDPRIKYDSPSLKSARIPRHAV